jgi:hypothetical protein
MKLPKGLGWRPMEMILQRRDAENAEISAEKTENQLSMSSLRLSLRSLRLCVEWTLT